TQTYSSVEKLATPAQGGKPAERGTRNRATTQGRHRPQLPPREDALSREKDDMGDEPDTECRPPLAKTSRYRGPLPHLSRNGSFLSPRTTKPPKAASMSTRRTETPSHHHRNP